MQSLGYEKPAIEKIKVYRWSRENTEKTQRVVDELHLGRVALMRVTSPNSEVAEMMRRAIRRFAQIDPLVVLPPGDYTS